MWEVFGWYGLLFSALSSLVIGFMIVVWYVATEQAKRLLNNSPLQPVRRECVLKQVTTQNPLISESSSGSQRVDEELGKIINLCFRDHLQSWYHPLINGSTVILDEAKSSTSHVISEISKRCYEPEFLPLFMESLVNILIEHLQLYKGVLSQVTPDKTVEKCIADCDNEGWSIICSGGEPELAYIRGVTELVLYLVLPLEDFQNPLFRSLSQDLLAEHVLLASTHYVTTAYYLNSTIIYLAKGSPLTGESLLTALSASVPEEVALTLSMAAEEINRIKRKGTTEQDHLQLNSLSDLTNSLSQMQEIDLREADEEQYREQFPSLVVTIPDHKVITEGRVRHAVYRIVVDCEHRQGPMEQWITFRRFADLHDLHLKLKEGAQSADLPSLPSQTKPFNKLDPTFLELKKQGMQSYLRTISSQEFLNAHPHLFHQIILFLTESAYTRQTTEIARTVDKLVQPLRRRSDSAKPNSPSPYRRTTSLLEDIVEDDKEDDEEEGVAILLTLLDDVFDVTEGDQWLQRQLSSLLRQLLASMLSDKMGRRMMETLDSIATADHIADLIGELRQSLWPDGYKAETKKSPSPETMHLTALLARSKLIGSVPDDLRRLLGSATIKKGIFRLFNMFQHQTLNLRLLYHIVEALLCSLYPERDLTHAFHNLRHQIQLKHKL